MFRGVSPSFLCLFACSSFILKAGSLASPIPSHKEKSSISLMEMPLTHANLNNGSRPQASFFGKHAEGWHWYDTLRVESLSNNKAEEERKQNNSPLLPQTPTEIIEAQRKALEKKLHAAIIAPTRENIISYLLVQRALMDQSQRFSEAWQQVVMTTPSLDETLIHPVDQNARHIYYDKQREERAEHIKKLAQEYGLFFFFKENCPYCHGFAPVVKRFAEKYGWSLLPISLDGGKLPEYPQAKRDNGIVALLRITHVPALIALHPQTGKFIPLAYGMISETEIEEHIVLFTRLSGTALHAPYEGELK